jgi:Na+(H+)/acetate symporter ActP
LRQLWGIQKFEAQTALRLGDQARNLSAAQLGRRFREPGFHCKARVDQVSLGLALVFGSVGPPHILMRFFHRAHRTRKRTRCSGVSINLCGDWEDAEGKHPTSGLIKRQKVILQAIT